MLASNFPRTSSSSSPSLAAALEELLSGKVLLKGRLVKTFVKRGCFLKFIKKEIY